MVPQSGSDSISNVLEKSMDDLATRGVVPVLNLLSRIPKLAMEADSPTEAWSPWRAATVWILPSWHSPLRKVPVVSTTLWESILVPSASSTPMTESPELRTFSTGASITVRFV